MSIPAAFLDYCRNKEHAAARARMAGYTTVFEDREGSDLLAIGSPATRHLFDGDFYRSAGGRAPDLPVVTLVRDSTRHDVLGEGMPGPQGDPTTVHLIHEGLAHVDADAVLGGIGVVREPNFFASVWHPELVALRLSRGLPRHPVQVIVTGSGQLPFDDCLMFGEPTLRVVILAPRRAVKAIGAKIGRRPWVRVVDAGEPFSMRRALVTLRAEGLAVVSALGGRRVASTLLGEGLVTDLYLTSSDAALLSPSHDIHDGPPILQRRVLTKVGRHQDIRARFEHLVAPTARAWTTPPVFGR